MDVAAVVDEFVGAGRRSSRCVRFRTAAAVASRCPRSRSSRRACSAPDDDVGVLELLLHVAQRVGAHRFLGGGARLQRRVEHLEGEVQRGRDRFALAGGRVEPERSWGTGRRRGGDDGRGVAVRGRGRGGGGPFRAPLRKFSSVFFSSSGVEVTYEPPPNCALTLLVRNFTWRSGLPCENAISFESSISSWLESLKRGVDRVADGLRDPVELRSSSRVDLLAQVAQEVLLARDAHEVRVEVAEAHVGERVVVAELLVAGLEVDRREVFADRAAAAGSGGRRSRTRSRACRRLR